MRSRHRSTRVVVRAGVAVGVVGLALVGVAVPPATAQDREVRADRSAFRACHASLLPAGTAGVDRREVTSEVDGLVQARLAPGNGREGDWDLAVFDKASGAVVAASAALRSRELAESFVRKGQQLVVQACRYDGPSRTATLGVDFLALTPQGTPTTAERAEVVRVETPRQEDKDTLLGLDLDLTEKGDATGVEVVLAGDADRETLRRSGLKSTTVDADLSRTSREAAERDRAYTARGRASGLPSRRTSYRHLYEYEYELKELARGNPRLVRAFTLAEPTNEGRDVVAVEIAEDVDNAADGKPVNVLMGVHHAREWPAGEHAVEWAHELVNGYHRDNSIRSLVARTRNIVVPIVNADGFSISREAEPKGDFTRFDYEMKRKNCRADDSPPQLRTGVCKANPGGSARGTDPNRNYAGFWGGAGAGLTWGSETFRGSAPFSEPETRNIRDLVSKRAVTNLITLHTYGNLVLRPPGVADVRAPLEEPVVKALGDRMASRNGYDSIPSWGLYDTTGTTEDWSYWATGGFGFTFEINTAGFHPPYEDAVVAEYVGAPPAAGAGKGGNRAAFLDMLANAADPAAHATLVGTAPKGYRLKVHKTFQTPTSPVRQPDGTTTPPIQVTDTVESTYSSTGGRFTWSVNPSTRPYVAGRYGRDPLAPPQAAIALPNPPGVPAENTRFPGNPVAESIPFTVQGVPAVDNGRFDVSVSWTSTSTDWDLYVLDAAGQVVTQSAAGGTNSERATLLDPPAGQYTAVLVNYDQVDPANPDDWAAGRVEFSSPVPPTYGVKEAYTLTCTDRQGRLVGLTDVFVDRGQTVDVGDVCTDSARTTKQRRR
ncbi:M14 family zinc carboxypeptidase [Saccharothrix syringae]|uniref:Peptidase M14 n=1 Tax=Saccharothrix syringae TaxID=103733 RepID=A0A5Q0GWM0_SACSY|nr:M14 family zinc carboxypeptidase [Saccharothrix syringae]QFZ18348.1 peptidase M14 [Saccharothrix syringae]